MTIINSPWATIDLPQSFQWPAEAFRKNLQMWKFRKFLCIFCKNSVDFSCIYDICDNKI